MVKPNFECAKCDLVSNFTKQEMKDHIRSHRIEGEAVENTQGLIDKELLLD